MRTIIYTSDNHSWLLRGFFHQWLKYVGPATRGLFEVEVAGFSEPNGLPKGVKFSKIGEMKDYPVNHWSDAVIEHLSKINDELVIILLEDYWLMRPVNFSAVQSAIELMELHKDVIRFDLTSDRMYCKDMQFAGTFDALDICRAKGPYSLSFQASIWRREMLLEVMRPNETPWESELKGTYRVIDSNYDVLGSFQWPLNYMICVNKGKFDREGQWMWPARTLKAADWKELDELGYTRDGDN
jgi:hypothetical protein